jgi:Family of unknown function (DUF6081)
LGAEAVTPETQAAAAAHDDFVTYDELSGPDLDEAHWSPARLPLPTGAEHIPLDPYAELVVGEGVVRVTIPRFSLSHDTFQTADSAKYLIFSTRQFELPPDRAATFAADLAVKNIGGEPADFRRGMAAFQAFDFDASKPVFSVFGTSTRVFAMHRFRDLDDAADPGRSQSIARWAGYGRAVAPVPGARGRTVSRHNGAEDQPAPGRQRHPHPPRARPL